ncbi:antiviral RADAR system adenosine triphosphatase RdrA [Massilia sp. W12]|uniref:antiviral RADAR system adenosine triphosphatase RdrA n=1 Tax=Massilia sp. W12 TaxID=3126507 RepID=UPI0030D32875
MTNEPRRLIFPIDQRESATQKRADTLLAADVYSKLHAFVKVALPSADDDNSEPGAQRQHRAILIDGARGTGKSSVLINLGLYLADVDKELFNHVHICKPIDPTLLEDHDNLFLNVIVAAVLSDKAVIDAQTRYPEKRAALHKQLQRLGSALEGLQKQRAQEGLDKLRSFIGNNQLVGEVDHFFRDVCNLLGKKLLILTIDDVDTSLDQAFENLEVVRRYLVSPAVLPIISGDQRLYHDVTWREFHGKLLKDSSYARADAALQAKELAKEYQRKILPLQYRLQMPSVAQYLQDQNIFLTHEEARMPPLPLPFFQAWVEAILNGAVNGVENSYLALPLKTVRSLAQLIYRVKGLLPDLVWYIAAAELWDIINVKRATLLHATTIKALKVAAFNTAHQNRKGFLKEFSNILSKSNNTQLHEPASEINERKNRWRRMLLDQFKFDSEAGAAFLVLQAQIDWFASGIELRTRNVFDTPLFQPLLHQQESLANFAAAGDLNDWKRGLNGRAPDAWLARLPSHAILPYPIPEAGRAISAKNRYRFSGVAHSSQNNLLIDLLLHKNFYSTNKKTVLICVGRIFELIITSFLRTINEEDVHALLQRPPFYSLSAIAATKTLTITDDDGKPEEDWPKDTDVELAQRDATISLLIRKIREWQSKYQILEIQVAPWLVYNVFNKVMNQAWLFNPPMAPGVIDNKQDEKTVLRVAQKMFNSIWSAFGSFEKGPLYELSPIIATVNIGDGEKFENSDLYRQNISPFSSENDQDTRTFGEKIRSITFLLGEHPLRGWIEQEDIDLRDIIVNTELSGLNYPEHTVETEVGRAKAELGKALGVALKSRVEKATLRNALRKGKLTKAEALKLHDRIKQEIPASKRLMATFLSAIEEWAASAPPVTKPTE